MIFDFKLTSYYFNKIRNILYKFNKFDTLIISTIKILISPINYIPKIKLDFYLNHFNLSYRNYSLYVK